MAMIFLAVSGSLENYVSFYFTEDSFVTDMYIKN